MTGSMPMNVPARQAYSKLLRQFHAGRMTNFDYERRYDSITDALGTDVAIEHIYSMNWFTYCDIATHTMTEQKRRLPSHVRSAFARAVLLLRTGFDVDPAEVEHERRFSKAFLLALCTGLVLTVAMLCVMDAVHAGGLIALFVVLLIVVGHTRAVFHRLFRTTNQPSSVTEEDPMSEYWPFATMTDFNAAKQSRVYLAGQTSTPSA